MSSSFETSFRPFQMNSGEMIKFLNNKAEDFNDKASQMANEILAKYQGTIYEGPVVIREYHYYDEPWFDPWYSRSPRVVVVEGKQPTASESKAIKDKNDAGIAMVAGVVAAFALYILSSSINLHEDASKLLKESKEFKKEIVENISYTELDECEYLIQTMKVADVKDKMCRRIKNSSTIDIALRASLLAASSFVLGSYFLNRSLMPIGIYGGVASGLGMLLKLGVDNTESKNVRDAMAIQELVSDLPNLGVSADSSTAAA